MTDINSIEFISRLFLQRSLNNIHISNNNSHSSNSNNNNNNNNNSSSSNNQNNNISGTNNSNNNNNNTNQNIINNNDNQQIVNSNTCNNNNNNQKQTNLDSFNFTNRIIRSNIIKNINFLKNSVENYFINSCNNSNNNYDDNSSSSSNYRDGTPTSINDLPDEILAYILKYLSPFDLRICCLVSTYWSLISSSNTLWYDKCLSQWYWLFNINEEKNKRLPNCTWKEFYKFWAKEYLNHTEWWQESFTRKDANKALVTQGKGTFLIRVSESKKNCLVISYNTRAQKPEHILVSYLGIYTGVSLYDEIGRIYPTLASLIRDKRSWLKRPFQSCRVYASKSKSKLEYIERMLNNPSERNGKSIDQLSLLHIACKWSFKQLVILLLEKGADINYKCSTKKGKPPLFFAVEFVHGQPSSNIRLEVLKILLSNENLNIDQLDSKGRSILHVIAKQHQQDSDKMLKLLLKNGANTSISSPKGLYPLHVIVKENNINMLNILLNLDKEDNNNNNTDNTDNNNHNHNHNSNNNNIDSNNINNDNSNNFKKININCKIELTPISKINDDYYSTPLHIASSNNNYSIIKLLLEHPNIEVDCLDNKNRTPLHRAVCNTQDWVNMARLGYPVQQHFSHQIIDILLKNKADPNLLDYQNKTPLHIAVEKGHRKSTHYIATSVRDLFTHEKVQSIYTKESLLASLNAGRQSKDIQKIVADVNYSIMCGYNENFKEPLDKTIIDHYNNISDILKKEFLNILK